MNNTEILALPDVVAALQSWWDETPGAFTRGVTSAVIADLLDDYGYEWPTDEGAVGWTLEESLTPGSVVADRKQREASRARRTIRPLTLRGRTQCIAAWAEELGVSRGTIASRLRYGWSEEEALQCQKM